MTDETEIKATADTLIRWSNGGCFGQCPVFTIDITSDGLLAYNGRLFVKKEGFHSIQLKPDELETLKKAFQNASFLNLDTAYLSELVDISSERISFMNHNVLVRGDAPISFRAMRKCLNELLLKYDLIDNKLFRKEFPQSSGIIIETQSPLDYITLVADFPEYQLLHARNINRSGTMVLLHTLVPEKRSEIVDTLEEHALVKNIQLNRSLEKRG